MLPFHSHWLSMHRPGVRPARTSRQQAQSCFERHELPLQRTRCNTSEQNQHVLLEQAVLADMPTEQLIQLLQKHGVQIPDEDLPQKQQQDKAPTSEQQHNTQQAARTPPPAQTQQQQQQQQPVKYKQPEQQQQQLAQQKAARAAHVAAAAARRAALLKRLAAARVAARARIVRLPLRLVIAGKQASRRYLAVPVDVEGIGFVDFLLDGTSYLSRITPELRSQLGMGPADGVAVVTGRRQSSSSSSSSSGSSSSGSSSSSSGSSGSSSSSSGGGVGGVAAAAGGRLRLRQRVQLPDMWLGTAKLPSQQAYVAPLLLPPRRQQQQLLTPSSSSSSSSAAAVGGLLGVQVLRCFDIDVDVSGNQLALHPAGHVELGLCNVEGTTPIPCRFTKSGTIVLPVSLAGSPPFTGLLDLSATTSILNWEAAALLGMTCTDLQQEQQQQQQQQQHDLSSAEAAKEADATSSSSYNIPQNMYGYFGNIEVIADDEALKRPQKPFGSSSMRPIGEQQHADSTPSCQQVPQQQQQQQHTQAHSSSNSSSNNLQSAISLNVPDEFTASLLSTTATSSSSSNVRLSGGANSSNSSSGSSSADRTSFSPLRVQQHQVAASAVKLCLGHARLAAAAAATGCSSSSSSSSGCCLALTPPSRFGVAGLRGLGQLGLSGKPAMVVGADIWARHRAVLCLKSGWLYLSDRQPQVQSSPASKQL